jgi:hypothetical protein
MDALAFISLQSNIIQCIDVSGKIIKNAKEVGQSALGVTEENISLQESSCSLRDLSTQIEGSAQSCTSSDYQDLRLISCYSVYTLALATVYC